MQIAELMTTEVLTATPEMPLKEAARLMSKNSVSGLPVVDQNYRVVGVVSEGDFVARAGAQARVGLLDVVLGRGVKAVDSETVQEVMTSRVHTVDQSVDHPTAARLMQRRGIKRLPVVDKDGRLVGIVSRSDILKVFTRSDEDIRQRILDHVIGEVVTPNSDDLEVAVEQGKVSLTGSVESRSEALLIAELSAEVDGVLALESKLRFQVDDMQSLEGPGGFRPR